MANRKRALTGSKQAKRRFAVLDREKAVKSAAVAINTLRSLSKFETSFAAWRCGLGHALELAEGRVNEILRFSGSGHLPADLFSVEQPISDDLGQARKDAAGAVKVLRNIVKDARADLSADEHDCDGLESAIEGLEVALNDLLPPPGAPPRVKLPFDDEEDEVVRADSEGGCEGMKR